MAELTTEEIGQFLAKLAENSQDVYWLSCADFRRIVYISPSFETIWGRPRSLLYENPERWIDFLHPDDVDDHHPIKAMAEKVKLFGQAARYNEQYRIIRPDGQVRWIKDRGFPVYNDKGECCGVTGVAEDITRAKEIEEQLRCAKEHAEQANIAKMNFLAMISHELRTPINAVLGMAQILKMKKMSACEHQECVEVIHQSAADLLNLINDTLDFSTIESGKINLTSQPFKLQDLVEQITLKSGYKAKEKGLALNLRFNHEMHFEILGDAQRVRQILTNLIDNAIKFTTEGSVDVDVDCQVNDMRTHVEMRVTDTGIGIEPHMLTAIFERFTQVHSNNRPYEHKYQGVGLGLAIVKQLVEHMGGTIDVDSEVGRGTRFMIYLDFPLGGSNVNYAAVTAALEAKPQTHQHSQVLLVEDNALNQKVACMMLQEMGIQPDVVETGEAALKKMHACDYDLVLMDIGLPDMTGIELTQLYRAQERLDRHLVIVALTAHAFEDDEKRCLAAGMDAYLVKPLMVDDLRQAVERWCAVSELT